MNIEDRKILNYWEDVVQKFKNKDRNEREEEHYQFALKKVKEILEQEANK